ncbi:protein phosphatase 2C [Tieghemostelium lacteum]|uniref:Protein phosphatase 2C n=1 Tax=Tieghemostelium lacteum TaxID=361077 RepID=A0A152A9A1_TIELA|nr:protein phosphatase 2C [Tieghemostelium lacteum]|eukprot:KYR02799.1 protein phosphatase 2C [Tieghemostelium lacteum]
MNIINFFKGQTNSSTSNGIGSGNGGLSRTGDGQSFVPSPILYMTPMAPIDYGIPDDMLIMEEGKGDMGKEGTLGSPMYIPSSNTGIASGVSDTMSSSSSSSTLVDSNLHNSGNGWLQALENLNFEMKFGCHEFQGGRKYMEDRYRIKTDFGEDDAISVFGVFDGHGGDKASSFVQKKLVTVLNKNLKENNNKTGYLGINSGSASSSPKVHFDSPNFMKYNHHLYNQSNFQQEIQNRSDKIQKALFDTYHQLDSRYCKKFRNKKTGGTTCLVAVLSNPPGMQPILVVANAGDSRGVLCRSGKAIPLSYDHKPCNTKEKQRIVSSGGKIEWDYDELLWRVGGVLSVSRGIGDIALKKWVICDPEFIVLTLKGPAPNKRKNHSSSLNSSPINGSPTSVLSTPSPFSSSKTSSSNLYKLSPSKSSSYIKAASKSNFVTTSPQIQAREQPRRHNSSPRFNIEPSHHQSPSSSIDTPPFSKEPLSEKLQTPISSSPSLSSGNTKTFNMINSSQSNLNCQHSKMYYCSQHQNNYGEVDQYFVLATDGIWDVFNNQELIDFINKTIEDQYHSKKLDWEPNEVAKKVVEEAFNRGSGDNSTVLIIKLYW